MDDSAFLRRFRNIQILRILHIVFQIIQLAFLIAVDNLFGGEYRLGLGVPVHHTQAAIDESFVVEVAENFQHTLAAFLVHGESGAVPVAAGSKLAELLEDDTTVFLCPSPGMLQELFASQVTLLDTLFS